MVDVLCEVWSEEYSVVGVTVKHVLAGVKEYGRCYIIEYCCVSVRHVLWPVGQEVWSVLTRDV